ncbi:Leucine-rich repeat [Sesbania bispinosa]|nr:Leucine-rich repeat [Sesbania bispinosa]
MGFTSHNNSILFLLFLYATTFHSCISSNLGVVHCNEKDQHTLSIFKQGVIDPFNRLFTWSTEEDCCAWKGVQCDNYTGRVTRVDLKPQRYGYRHYQFQPLRGNLSSLIDLRMVKGNNSLSGEISETNFSKLDKLKVLKLKSSTFAFNFNPEWIPPFQLRVLDLANTSQGPNFPPWIYTQKSLETLDISSSKISFVDGEKFWKFVAGIKDLCLSNNFISGDISQSIYNITAMAMDDVSKKGYASYTFNLFTKGHEYEYRYNGLSRTIDFSSNNLSGEIPLEIFKLVKVQTLNLSHNHLTGSIPETIGDMKSMESLDLSNNELYGEVPQSMTVLSFLNYLNLSCNSFYGKIPLGTQLQSFDASSYLGNLDLCGAPLTKNCSEENLDNKLHGGNEDEHGGTHIFDSLIM